MVAFDTNVVDLTERCADPVDLLFGFQLGGGTIIDKSVAYCQQFVENPSKTLFFLITDLEEGGNRAALLRRLEELKGSGVTVVCLLGPGRRRPPLLRRPDGSAGGGPGGIPCFACSPERLPQLLERAFQGPGSGPHSRKEFETRKKSKSREPARGFPTF